MFHLNEKAEYVNEILSAQGKCLFKTTCSEDPHHPMIRDNPSSIWLEIIKKINAVTHARSTDKLTISGPHMFGFSEYAVCKVIQEMPGADRLQNYKMK
jgi:hypothetical protein